MKSVQESDVQVTLKKKVYALFTDDVKARDKYSVTTPPDLFFRTKFKAKMYVRKRYGTLSGTKILSYYVPKSYPERKIMD